MPEQSFSVTFREINIEKELFHGIIGGMMERRKEGR